MISVEVVRTLRVSVCALTAALLLQLEPASAQNLTFSLLGRYFEALRVQAGIPGISAAVVQGGVVVWDAGLGKQNVEESINATAETPYPIGELSQTLGSTLLLQKCLEQSHLEVSDKIIRWVPAYPEQQTTVAQLLSHTSTGGTFKYDPNRFAALTAVFESCASGSYARTLANDLLDVLGMAVSVPDGTLGSPTVDDRRLFTTSQLARYADVLRQTAVPYRVDSRGRATRSDYTPRKLTASSGVVATVRDLARFDGALSRGFLLDRDTLVRAWTRSNGAGGQLPTGLGWFVQVYNGEPLVWQFGLTKDAYSSLILKLPNRDTTLIVLANSDGLSSSFGLENGDVTTSVFAKTFLKLLGL